MSVTDLYDFSRRGSQLDRKVALCIFFAVHIFGASNSKPPIVSFDINYKPTRSHHHTRRRKESGGAERGRILLLLAASEST